MQTHPAPAEAWTESIVKSPQTPRPVLYPRGCSLIDDVQVNYRRNTAKAVDQLEYIRTKIEEIRARAFVKAEKALRKQAPELIDNENQWSKKLLSELTGEAKSAFSDITEAQAQKLLKNSIQINKTWDQWWTSTAYGDTMRIANVINSGIVQGLTIPQMTSLIMGTKAGNYEDGVLSTSRRHARNMARTLCAGISNQAKDQFYRDNQDIIPQVEWLDTLDGRTCPSCAGLSRQRYNTEDPHPVPPLHPQCRCVLIPVTELTDLGEDVPRAAANADFDAEAKRMYEEKYPQKRFEDLAPSTREQYRHKAIHEYEERTGKPAFTRAPGSMTFSEFFEQSSEQFKKDWLKPGKYALYKSGKYPITAFIPPHPDRAFGVKQLKEMDIESFKTKIEPPKQPEDPNNKHLEHRKKQLKIAKQNRAEREAKKIGARMINGDHDIVDDLLAVNPKFNDGWEWQNNCQRCVTAYEMRRRGIDVEAKPREADLDKFAVLMKKDGTLNPTGYIGSVYKNARLEEFAVATQEQCKINIQTRMTSFGDGSRAIVRVRWRNGGGHVFIAEQVDGDTKFIDPQTGNMDASRYFSLIKPEETCLIRVDNLKIDDNVNKCCKPR